MSRASPASRPFTASSSTAAAGADERSRFGGGADLLRQPGVARDHVLKDADHAAVLGAGDVPGDDGALLGEPVPFAQVGRGADLAGPVGEGGDVEPVRLHQVRAQARRDPAAAVEVVDEPGVVQHEAPFALAALGGGSPGGAEDVVPVRGAVHLVVPEAVLPRWRRAGNRAGCRRRASVR